MIKHTQSRQPLRLSYEAAVNWLVAHRIPESGIAITNSDPRPYPEVTGYLIPTLLRAGEIQLAITLADWLISIQSPDGGFHGTDGSEHLFDTGQVLRGLLAVVGLVPGVETHIRRAAEWLLGSCDEGGVIRPFPGSAWSKIYSKRISENIHLYVLPPLLEAGRILDEHRYTECALKSLDYYLHKPDLLHFDFLTHFYGYVLEALVDLGRHDLARAGLEPVLQAQHPDGLIPAVPGAQWMCTPGSAQMAVVGYKLGLNEFANATMDRLLLFQMPSGGFLGSYGPGASYCANAEPSWACKYFLDACHLRIPGAFDGREPRFVAAMQEVREHFQDLAISTGIEPDYRTLRRYGATRNQIEARSLAEKGFLSYEQNDLAGARRSFLGAIRLDKRWLMNRGVLSIIARSILGPKVISNAQGLKTASRYARKS